MLNSPLNSLDSTYSLHDLHQILRDTTSEICDISRQITANLKQKKIKRDLKDSMILSSVSDSVIITDNIGNIIELNASAENMLEEKFINLKSKNICEFVSIDDSSGNSIIKTTTGKIIPINMTMKSVKNQLIYFIKPNRRRS